MEKKRYRNKPRKCIYCGSTSIATYVYGYPTSDINKGQNAEKYAIGGCCIGGDDPVWRCNGCGHKFYHKIFLPDPYGYNRPDDMDDDNIRPLLDTD